MMRAAPLALGIAALAGAAWPGLATGAALDVRADSDTAIVVNALPSPPGGLVLDADVTEWQFTPPALSGEQFWRPERSRLAALGRRPKLGATVWMALDDNGLWVAGRVEDDSVRLPATVSSEEILGSDHAEVWLAMPSFAAADSGSDEPLARLFTRLYTPSGDSSVRELWAHEVEHNGGLTTPVALPHCCSARARSVLRRTVDGWSFEMFVPAADFPATTMTTIAEMAVAVEIVDADGRGNPVRWSSAQRMASGMRFARLIPSRPLAFDMSVPVLDAIIARADAFAAQRGASAHAFYFPARPVTLAFVGTTGGGGRPVLEPLGLVAEQPSASCGGARAYEMVIGADSIGNPVPALVSLARAEPRDTVVSVERLGGDDSLVVQTVAPCRHLRFDWFDETTGDSIPSRYHVTVLTLDSTGVIARVLDEDAPALPADVANGGTLPSTPRRAVSAGRNSFGVEWINASSEVVRRVLWRWNAGERRYVSSDSTGSFPTP